MSNQASTQHEQAIEQAHQACQAPIWIRDEGELAQATEQWKHTGLLALDTEFMRERTYYPQLALIQVSDGHQVWLIDSPALSSHSALAPILSDPNIIKALHSPREDLEVLYQATGELPRPLFDTQAAAAICGGSLQTSYGALLADTLGVQLDKELARSDWLQRPLSPEQVKYACCDVAYLPELTRLMQQRLDSLERSEWFDDDMAFLLRECVHVTADDALYLSLPGAGRLAGEELKIAQRLCQWREQVAREQNLPRQFVIRNEVLLQLAISPPSRNEELFRMENLRPSQARRYGTQILQQLELARQSREPAPVPILTPDLQQKVKRAQKLVRAQAEELGVEAAVVLSRRDIERWLKEGQEHIPSRLRSWRWPLVGSAIQKLLWA